MSVDQEKPGRAGTPASETEEGRPLVLIAEDNADNLGLLLDYLRAKGYALIAARNGREAVQLAAAHRPRIVLMDIQMPDMDGLQAIRLIRADHRLARTPIIALTALAMVGDRERCLAAGATDYMSKPVSLRQLNELMRGYI
jgi:CheY-like chemotaxis protein